MTIYEECFKEILLLCDVLQSIFSKMNTIPIKKNLVVYLSFFLNWNVLRKQSRLVIKHIDVGSAKYLSHPTCILI